MRSRMREWNKIETIYGRIRLALAALNAAGDSNVLNFIESKLNKMVKNVAMVHPI